MFLSPAAKDDEERGRRSMKNNNPILPIELIKEILLRLPVKSLLRFKSVCKSWLSLISNPQFGISHYDLAASPTHRILIRSSDFYVQSIDIDARKLSRKSAAVHFLLPPTSPPHHLDFYYHADHHDKVEILGSCRGLVLLYYEKSEDLILWNPSIGVHKRIPDFAYHVTFQLLYGFGYDASSDDYLLIMIAFDSKYVENAIHIFSFKTEFPSLNRDYVGFPYEILDDNFGAGSLLNGALHWLVFCNDKEVLVIIAFDLVQRSLSEIPLFDYLTMERYEEIYSLRVMGGCLSVCCLVQGGETVEIWVMKEYKVHSSWTKSISILAKCLRDRFSPICITKDGRMLGSNICGRLEKLNYKGEMLDRMGYGAGDLYETNLQSAMYRESLLSLPTSPSTIIRKKWGYDSGETSEDEQL